MPLNPRKYEHCQPRYPVKRRGKDDFKPTIQMPKDFTSKSRRIAEIEQEMNRFILSGEDIFRLVTDAYSTNVHYSTELEGNPLPLSEVQRITRDTFRGEEERKPIPPAQEIINHLHLWILPDYFKLPWSVETITNTHYLLTRHDEAAKPGVVRSGPVEGDFAVWWNDDPYFFPAPSTHVEKELNRLVEWVNNYSTGYHPIVAASVMFHEFESIHPFHDDNGRTGRTLFHGYLKSMGYPNSSLCKIEYHLLKDSERKKLYYDILAWTDQHLEYVDLVSYITEAILDSYEESLKTFESKDLLKGLGETTKRLLTQAKEHGGWFSISDATAWVDGRSSDTIRNHMNTLIDIGALESKGKTRGKKFRYRNPITEYMDMSKKRKGW